jgi:outer membrane protein assembly factor BamB
MTRIAWWLVDKLSRGLTPDERDAVYGDFAELELTGEQALREMIGLAARREAEGWRAWRPWIVLAAAVIPLGLLLGLVSQRIVDNATVYGWLYTNNWSPAILESPGPRRDLIHFIARFALQCAALIATSWVGGLILGSLVRRAIGINVALFVVVLLTGGNFLRWIVRWIVHDLAHAPVSYVPFATQWLYRARENPLSTEVFSTMFYGVVFPLIVPAVLVMLPLLAGIRRASARPRRSSGAGQSGVGAASSMTGSAGAAGAAGAALVAAAVLSGSIVTAAAATAPPDSQDYPQWRGVNRDGAASAFTAPAVWPDTLTRRWKVDVGEGYATPLIVGRTVYIFTRRGDDEVMTAVDAATGKERWRTGYPAPYTPSQPASKHGAGPKATPLLHDGHLYTLGISGIVAAFDAANGKLLWRTPPPAEPPFFGAASSPLAERGLIVVHPGNYGPLTAFDAKTGAIKWTAGAAGFFASPIAVTLDGTRQIVTVTQKSVIGVSAADGAVLWEYPFDGGSGGPMPVVYGGTIIVSGLKAGVTAFTPARRDGKWTTDTAWETKDVAMYVSNPVVIGDTLFGLSHRSSGQFFAIDARSGKVLWLGDPREAANTAIAKAGDLLFLLNDDAELIVARGNPAAFTPLKRYTVADTATWAQPAISGNRLFIKDVSSLTLWTLD